MTTKNNILYALSTLWILLFTACSQEEVKQSPSESNRIRISATLPQDAATRTALPFEDGHQLRCILEVWNKTESRLIERIEKLGTEATGGKLQFTFNVPSATDYECLLWADFIASDATAADGKYTDKYYTTTSLKAIDCSGKPSPSRCPMPACSTMNLPMPSVE